MSPQTKKRKINNLKKVKSAILLAQVLRPDSLWVRGELSKNQSKKIRDIFDEKYPRLKKDSIDQFIADVNNAIIDLSATRAKSVDIPKAIATVSAIALHADGLAKAWHEITKDHNLNRKLKTVMAGNFRPLQNAEPTRSTERIIADASWASGLQKDLLKLAQRLEPLALALKQKRLKKAPFDHWCVFRIARAWQTATGELPTCSHNIDPENGKWGTPFRAALAIVFDAVSERTVREVVEACKTS